MTRQYRQFVLSLLERDYCTQLKAYEIIEPLGAGFLFYFLKVLYDKARNRAVLVK